MRPLRLVLLLIGFIALPFFVTFLSLLSAHPRSTPVSTSNSNTRSGRLRALFSFHTPSSLWPPSAIISLTDDNSTFFLARPAAFGPLLPSKGLSGQLWVGSGFGDDTLRRGDPGTGAEGELGCSDVPGWEEGGKKHSDGQDISSGAKRKTVAYSEKEKKAANGRRGKRRRSEAQAGSDSRKANPNVEPAPSENDGTDDHLHHPLPGSDFSKPTKPGQPADNDQSGDKSKPPTHADIQSLQESAEIAGKVVLLSRGGCGFLEKVKWVQRRGGIALIVGDDTRGGGLVTMYARGDTSNVTIPSLFTSHTTAHLLSSLVPPEEIPEDKKGEDGKKQNKDSFGLSKNGKKGKKVAGPTFTAAVGVETATKDSSTGSRGIPDTATTFHVKKRRGWFRSLLSKIGFGSDENSPSLPEDSRRPPSSGNLDWVLVEDFNEEEPAPGDKKNPSTADSTKETNGGSGQPDTGGATSKDSSGDGFVIGVQDWRDPDLVPTNEKQDSAKSQAKPGLNSDSTDSSKSGQSNQVGDGFTTGENEALKGGSITPGSGEYGNPDDNSGSRQPQSNPQAGDHSSSSSSDANGGSSWLDRLKWSDKNGPDQSDSTTPSGTNPTSNDDSAAKPAENGDVNSKEEEPEHEGLWVTLTPTNMSSSPFFDTLLVLVVSPLITLTVVYALLLLRSRIRRRRWRAPKSVVDRLPVRTYHTISCSSTASSSQLTSPNPSSPNSPLLRTAPRSISSRSRPRSQTTSGVVSPALPSQQLVNDSATNTNGSPQEKALSSGPHSFRRKYNGRQVECVVCLEEYVDGQSRVMSLPCGHEFHVECM
jgi:hypothetical protein